MLDTCALQGATQTSITVQEAHTVDPHIGYLAADVATDRLLAHSCKLQGAILTLQPLVFKLEALKLNGQILHFALCILCLVLHPYIFALMVCK